MKSVSKPPTSQLSCLDDLKKVTRIAHNHNPGGNYLLMSFVTEEQGTQTIRWRENGDNKILCLTPDEKDIEFLIMPLMRIITGHEFIVKSADSHLTIWIRDDSIPT